MLLLLLAMLDEMGLECSDLCATAFEKLAPSGLAVERTTTLLKTCRHAQMEDMFDSKLKLKMNGGREARWLEGCLG
jgi:hypothetical protein